MGATFSRIKNWTTEILSNTDLNAEIDNILNNLGPAGVDGYSATAAQMRISTDPGESGSESLATSLAGELERIRFVIKEMKGGDVSYWYQSSSTSFSDILNVLQGSLQDNRISSGKTSSNSSRLIALSPHGASASLTLSAAATPFVYYVDGTQYSITANTTVTGLSLAPSTNNTCSVNDTLFADDQYTQWLGEHGTGIPVDGMGSEISSLAGKYAGFSVNNGSSTEYFIGYVESSTRISKAQRGCFISSASATFPRIAFSDNDVISLTRLTWVFATTSAALAVTYNVPTVSGTQPTSPATGDYWFDIANDTWKIYNSTTWIAANATLIGVCMQNTSGCIAAMTFDVANTASDLMNMQLEYVSATTVQSRNLNPFVNVFGTTLRFGQSRVTWDITANLDAGITEAANTFYYLYLKESGVAVISDKAPTDRTGDLGGLYHPAETWRCVGMINNNGSSNFDRTTLHSFKNYGVPPEELSVNVDGSGYGLATAVSGSALTVRLTDSMGSYPSALFPVIIPFRNGASATTGNMEKRQIFEMPRITVPSTATLGHGTAADCYVFVYLFRLQADSLELGVSSGLWDDARAYGTTTAISTSADDDSMYAVTSHAGSAFRRVGYGYYATGLNGTWSNPTRLSADRVGYEGIVPQLSNAGGVAAWPVNGSVFTDLTSLVLGPGRWKLSGAFNVLNSNTGTVNYIQIGISTTSGDSSSGLVAGLNFMANSFTDTTANAATGVQVNNYVVSVSTATTYYLKGWISATDTDIDLNGYSMSAERIRDPKIPT